MTAMKILYYDCFAGICGDMHLGAMIDAGVDPDHLIGELNKLPLDGFRLNICRDKRKSIEGTRVDVLLEDDHPEVTAAGHHHKHTDIHRNLQDIEEIINKSGLTASTTERALKMFRLIAEAEAKIHGMPVENVHFHEVGAIDSIVDITGAAICIEYLAPDRILSSPVELGGGMIRCAHGTMPVPAPATSEILKNIPVKLGGTHHEATTPTGAAILAANVDEFVSNPAFIPEKTAYGIGQRDTEVPNILRVIMARSYELTSPARQTGQSGDTGHLSSKIMIECNLDDMNPEWYPPILETLIAEGANDAFLTPSVMKKGRPGVVLSVLCEPELQQKLTSIVLKQSTTIGVRTYPVSRTELKRETETVSTSLGDIAIKKCFYRDELIKWKPEFEDCKQLADQHNISLSDVHRIIHSEYKTGTSAPASHTPGKSK